MRWRMRETRFTNQQLQDLDFTILFTLNVSEDLLGTPFGLFSVV